jgi:hypothetical protein
MKIYRRFALAFGLFVLFSHMATAQLPALSINPVETEVQRVTVVGYQSQTEVIFLQRGLSTNNRIPAKLCAETLAKINRQRDDHR